ncbi:killer toxin resistant protein [Yamadazyma tenuis]|nr:killer toxin resistant protein [Yamadazyma tenuis]
MLQTPEWSPMPFHLHLLESIAAIDESLYGSAAYSLVNDDYDEEFLLSAANDELVYQLVHDSAGLDPINKSLADLKTASKYYAPRIQTHFSSYLNDIQPKYRGKCDYDMFGTKLERKPTKQYSWLLSGDRIYCTPDDLFALEFSKRSDMSSQLLPFDRVIGQNSKAPLLILYGDLNHEGFNSMFNNLYQSAEAGKLRFVWRYVPSMGAPDLLPNYASTLDLKNSSTPSSIGDFGLKLASKVLSNNVSPREKYRMLNSILEDFPSHLVDIDSEVVDSDVADSAAANEKMGTSKESVGIYLNGAPVNGLELDAFKLFNRIEEEVNIIQEIIALGFNLDQARTLLVKFALHAAVKLSEFNSGSDENRYKVHENSFVAGAQTKRGGVVFINDIETDENYQEYTTVREKAYIDMIPQLAPGQFPPLKENIHDLIFVINLSNQEQLKVFFTFSKLILDRGIPQQIGVLPFGDSELDIKIAKYFYFLYDTTTSKEALAFLYKIFMRETDNEITELLEHISIQGYEFSPSVYLSTLEKFSITEPSIVFNGIITDLKSDWRRQMGSQIRKDVSALHNGLRANKIGFSMKKFLHQSAKSERNLNIIPKDSSGFKYKKVSVSLIEKSSRFRLRPSLVVKDDIEVWLVGDLSQSAAFNQLIQLFKLMSISSFDIQLRVIDLSKSQLLSKIKQGDLNEKDLDNLLVTLEKESTTLKRADPDSDMKQFVSEQGLPPHHSYILVNSRYFRIDNTFSLKQVESIISFEKSFRLSIFDSFLGKYPEIFESSKVDDFYDEKLGIMFHDWKDLLVTRIMKSFFVDDDKYVDDVARYDFSSMNMYNSFVIDNELEPLVDVLVVVDPLVPYSQQIVGIVKGCINLPFIRTRILLQPQSQYLHLPIKRYFKGVYPSYPIKFDSSGFVDENLSAQFSGLSDDVFSVDLLSPKRWVAMSKFAPKNLDLDYFKFSSLSSKDQEVVFELSKLLIEGFATDVTNASPPGGLTLKVSQGDKEADTIIMSNLGYFQLPIGEGTWNLTTGASPYFNYGLLSASSDPFDSSTVIHKQVPLNVFNLDGLVLRPRLVKQASSLSKAKPIQQDGINIFTVSSGHLYERLSSIMMASVRSNTQHPVTFWLLENYLSPNFKALLPKLAEEYKFEYHLITYKWPMWLRSQFSRQRTIWGYKILFLDVLFPIELDHVIFVDADQINRSDMIDLVKLDMGDAPYGFVPMCESKEEMDGFRFWKTGYWKDVLKDDLKYHISALYKVNLKRFREIGAGDRLRSHYQKLSSDPNSLSNLDQDLPNNMQRTIPIYSLPQEYLWCETWCSDSTLQEAKNIDLCNNPLTKENKLDVAKRLIPEWSAYDKDISALIDTIEVQESRKEYEINTPVFIEDKDEDGEEDDEYEHDEL